MIKFQFLFVLFAVIVIFSSAITPAFASHGSSGGGGCSGDCNPPTLGKDDSGRTFVNNGFTINGQSYDVEYFKQDIPTETVNINEPVTISLKIYENSGTSSLTHVFLKLGLEEKTISGVKVSFSPVEILWENPFDSNPYVSVEDPNNLVTNVIVESTMAEDAFGTSDSIMAYDFTFTPIEKFDTEVILVAMWDHKNNVWTNYFHNALLIEDDEVPLESEMILTPQFENSVETAENSQADVDSESHLLPTWIKTTAKFWSQNEIDDVTFKLGIQYLIEKKIIKLSDNVYSSFHEQEDHSAIYSVIPSWVKNNASLWAENKITDSDFLNGLEFLVNKKIILI